VNKLALYPLTSEQALSKLLTIRPTYKENIEKGRIIPRQTEDTNFMAAHLENVERVEKVLRSPVNDLQTAKEQINKLAQAFLDINRSFHRFETEVTDKLNELIRSMNRLK
jgi:predicted transcriptional regulator